MLSFLLIITCLNFDALSLGITQGLKNAKIKLRTIIFISFFSTLLFFLFFWASKYIYRIFDKKICNYINGIFLIVLGLFFSLKKDTKKIVKNYFIETIIISLDAIFTATFCGYQYSNYLIYVIFYFFNNLFFIYLGNRIFYKLSNKSKINTSKISGLIFIALGTLKIFGI